MAILSRMAAFGLIGLTMLTPARADDCVTSATAAAGFVAEMPGGQRYSVRGFGKLVESTLFGGPDRKDLRTQTTFFEGFFPLETVQGPQVLQLKPPAKLGEFFPLKVGNTVEMAAQPTVNGAPGKPWTINLEVLDEGVHSVGACDFRVFRVARKVVEEGGNVIADAIDYYAPDIRFVIARETKSGDGKMKLETYKRIRPRGRSGPL